MNNKRLLLDTSNIKRIVQVIVNIYKFSEKLMYTDIRERLIAFEYSNTCHV